VVARDFAGYRVEALVGKGGMAEVYRATVSSGPRKGQTVALKRLLPELARDPAFVALFEREGEITRRLRHPAIVEVFDTGIAGGTPYLVMEYVDGRNLKQILAQCAARRILLPVDFGAYVAHVLADALAHAHAHAGVDAEGRPLGIVHCDLSPSNVFVSRLGEVKLGDFGVALTPGAALGTPGGGAFGKVRYLAPEQLRGERIGPAVDLFALGAVLYEVLTNVPAFPGADVNEVGQAILGGRASPPSAVREDVPASLDVLVLRALAVEAEARPRSAAEFARDLSERYDRAIGTPLAIAAVVRGLFGATAARP
jgi:eukaryotic-like serine/threonine-protein kinase